MLRRVGFLELSEMPRLTWRSLLPPSRKLSIREATDLRLDSCCRSARVVRWKRPPIRWPARGGAPPGSDAWLVSYLTGNAASAAATLGASAKANANSTRAVVLGADGQGAAGARYSQRGPRSCAAARGSPRSRRRDLHVQPRLPGILVTLELRDTLEARNRCALPSSRPSLGLRIWWCRKAPSVRSI